jgi:hypothetical protein
MARANSELVRPGINSGLFLVGLLCFFYPFVTGIGGCIRSVWGPVAGDTVTGWQLATGEYAGSDSPVWPAAVALVFCALGVFLSWLRYPLGPVMATGLGLVAALGVVISLALLSGRTRYGWWGALLASLSSGLWGVVRIFLERPGSARHPETPAPTAHSPPNQPA